MFGFVQANIDDLSKEQQSRYRSVYCGLCHALGNRHGLASRFGLTYDMAFLAILLSSLYEPNESESESRCIAHPVKTHKYVSNKYIDYSADMTVALVYFKYIDDWNDDHSLKAKSYSSLLEKAYKNVKKQWPKQCSIIENELTTLSKIEKEDTELSPDLAANSFGRLMAGLFVLEDDIWSSYLSQIGYGLGKYIYLLDAAIDYDEDIKKGNYNPLKHFQMSEDDLRTTLKSILGQTSNAFEKLPLIQDEEILKNILYSGIWTKYNSKLTEKKETDNGK